MTLTYIVVPDLQIRKTVTPARALSNNMELILPRYFYGRSDLKYFAEEFGKDLIGQIFFRLHKLHTRVHGKDENYVR